jgi:PST family polysaccharide transporter
VLAGLAFPFTAVTSVQSSLLRREMSFRTIARVELLGGTIVQAIVSMSLAFLGFGPYAIILGHLSRLPLMTLLYFRATDYRPTRKVDRTKLRELFGFGGHMTLAGVVDFAAYSVPDFVISKLLKSTGFGLYSWSTKLVTFPLFKIATAVTAVGFPTFSKIQEDLPRMRRAYVRMVTCIAAICFPMMAGLACLAEEVVTALFRAEWHGTAPIIQVLCLMGAMLSIGTTVGTIYQSRGRVDIEWKLNLVQGVVTACVLLAAPRDVVSMTWFVVAVRAAMMLPTQATANRLIGLPHRDYVLAIAPPTALSLVMSAGVLGTTWILSGYGPAIRLAAGTLAGAAVYASCLRFATPNLYAMLKAVVASRRSKPDAGSASAPDAEAAQQAQEPVGQFREVT